MNTIVPAIGFGIVTASILAVAGVGFTLQFGVTNILNLAYGEIAVFGGKPVNVMRTKRAINPCETVTVRSLAVAVLSA